MFPDVLLSSGPLVFLPGGISIGGPKKKKKNAACALNHTTGSLGFSAVESARESSWHGRRSFSSTGVARLASTTQLGILSNGLAAGRRRARMSRSPKLLAVPLGGLDFFFCLPLSISVVRASLRPATSSCLARIARLTRRPMQAVDWHRPAYTSRQLGLRL